MPFTDYTALRAGVQGWLHRKNLVARIPEFIALAELKINRIAQVRLMEHEIPLTAVVGERAIDLPPRFTAPLGVWLSDVQPREELVAVVPEALPVGSVRGRPRHWAIDGTRLAFERPVDAAYPVVLRYRGGFALSEDAPANALLAKYPDLYLYGALLASAPWLRDVDSMALWQAMYDRTVSEINRTESRSRAAAPLRTELAAVLGGGCYDINRGH